MLNLRKWTSIIFVLVALTFSVLPHSICTTSDIVAIKTDQTITIDGSGSESVWADASSEVIGLSATPGMVWWGYYGGNISSTTIKAVHNGTWLFILASWDDPTKDNVEKAPSIDWAAAEGGWPGGHAYKPAEDKFGIMWNLGPFSNDLPSMKTTSQEWSPEFSSFEEFVNSIQDWALMKGEANMWLWDAAVSDSAGTNHTSKYYGSGPNKGQNIVFPYSFAHDLYLDTSHRYEIGRTYWTNWTENAQTVGSPNWTEINRPALVKAASTMENGSPYTVLAKGTWSNGKWTLEIGRPFSPPVANEPYSVTLEEGNQYQVYFELYQGGAGEINEVASVSPWHTLEIQASPQTPNYVPYILTAALVALVTALVVGYAVYYVTKPRKKS